MLNAFRWGVAVAVMILTVPSVASAQNLYAAIRGGPGFTSDSQDGAFGFEDTTQYNTGFTGSAALGYALPFGFRVEGEFGFVYIPLKSEGGEDVDGSIKNYLLMANAYYDLRLAALGPFRPYIGFGLGAARVNIEQEIFRESVGHKVDVNTPRTSFAYQARAGVTYDVNRLLDLSLGYRYVHIDSGTYSRFGHAVGNVGALNNHSVELGVAFKF
jgi:opacity protein-like surface antigen